MDNKTKELIEAAEKARENSYAPYSKFRVGAAVETKAGKIYSGCNIENASYGITVCGERVAVWKALSEGEREFSQIAVVVDTEELTPPCGVCRQIIWEFCGNIPVTLANLSGKSETLMMEDLLPRAFGRRFLEQNKNA